MLNEMGRGDFLIIKILLRREPFPIFLDDASLCDTVNMIVIVYVNNLNHESGSRGRRTQADGLTVVISSAWE